MRDVRIGHVAGVYVDGECARVIGLDIKSAGGVHRFLPWIASELDDGGVSVRSAFLLVDDWESYSRLGARGISDPDELARLRIAPSGRVAHDEETVSAGGVVGTRLR